MKVGYIGDRYFHKRVINNRIEGAQYVPLKLNNWEAKIYSQLLGDKRTRYSNKLEFYYYDIDKREYDVLHMYNTVCCTKKNWMISFETAIPRMIYGEAHKIFDRLWVEHNIDLLKKDNCLAMLPMSQNAYENQLNFLAKYGYENDKELLRKMKVLHPPQDVLTNRSEISEKSAKLDKEISFIFVGNDVFRKGGLEMAKAFEKFANVYNIQVHVVGKVLSTYKLGYGLPCGDKEIMEFKNIVRKNSSWFHYYPQLPNHKVLNLMKQCNVGLLPSYADSYGFAVLEMQACGCPVITTDIRAFPETNNDEIGWMSHIDSNLYYKYCTDKKKSMEIRELNMNNMIKIIDSILNNIDDISVKAEKSLECIEKNHSPVKYSKALKQILQRKL